ncbi:beta-galactosidase [Echinicola pacifica]|uniref:Beta-galactosidase n=1 Tax=Echinicola pacifica TaxID=346377 RepID=A0A918Q544_9BACT|nr:glycoside hydrolase family 2 TIM barrel-domain containing protein [Echinicola pacifica]GGZ32104.1 beta-galactosidase [Echinicola pacifica]
MKNYSLIIIFFLSLFRLSAQDLRQEFSLKEGWKFTKGEVQNGESLQMDEEEWQSVTVPHDWAIYGPFDENNDLQVVAVTQNGEKVASRKTGRTGGLPYMGIGWYRNTFDLATIDTASQRVFVIFDGAMSEANVFLNGQKVGFWPYGYNTFYFDITDKINQSGEENLLAVRLENKEQSSRWYPGAGLYRNVHILVVPKVHIPIWGTYITTPFVSEEYASVNIKTEISNIQEGEALSITTRILDPQGQLVSQKTNTQKLSHGRPLEQYLTVEVPELWSPETPHLYSAHSVIEFQGKKIDEYSTTFGIRKVEFIADKGFFLNGQPRKFKGVNLHHDLGPLGAAVNTAAIRRQLQIMKDMGADAIRTSHNMPAPELVQLCDEMGLMLMVESFDEWDRAKSANGYHRFFEDWAEKDLVNMVRHYRNNASVIMWSIGNEVPTQCSPEGYKVAKYLQDICHREDPSRLVTAGMDQVSCVLDNGFAAMIDIAGFNYRTHRYQEAYERLPHSLVLGSETGSTVSSRGVYHFPVEKASQVLHEDHQSSSYDLEYCYWSNLPEDDFALADDFPWTMGQFVWTGFDYLGEPTPYDTDAWPNHSSMFGMVDLAGIPKDRYYLYQSIWNTEVETLHILPHWNWEGREGESVPVFVYTNHPKAELFVNGESMGIRDKGEYNSLQERYRLMWMEVPYQAGELRVIAYDENGEKMGEKTIHTAGKPDHLLLQPEQESLIADGEDLAFFRVQVVDKEGNLCPVDQREVSFSVAGEGLFRAVANGDPTSLELFHLPQMKVFNGQLTLVVQASKLPGEVKITAKAKGLKSAVYSLHSQPSE